MFNFRASINNIMNARNHPDNSLDFPDPATLPTHCFVMDGARVNAPQANIVVPVVKDLPAPNIMDPALGCGLSNPNAYVRGSALEVVGKVYGVRAMKEAEEERNAKARADQHISVNANVPFTPATLTEEELAAFEELVDEEQLLKEDEDEDEATKGKGKEGEGEPVDLEIGGEETTVEEKEEGQPGVGAAAETGQKKPAEKQKKKKKQARPAPVGTAWFLQHGKELDSKRIY